jgi:hypothetical protein
MESRKSMIQEIKGKKKLCSFKMKEIMGHWER